MGVVELKQLATERGRFLRRIYNNAIEVQKLDTGFKELNKRTHGGLKEGDFVVIGARPFMGGDTLMRNLAYNLAACNELSSIGGVLFFSSNMDTVTVVDKMICKLSGIDYWKMRSELLKENDIGKICYAVNKLSELSINIDDTTHMTMAELTSRIWKVRDQRILDSVIIDDLDMLLPYNRKSSDYEQKLDEVTHGLRELASELKIPIIVAVKLPDHDGKKKSNPRPSLADIQQYGSLGKDASVIAFLHHPNHYENDFDTRNELDEVKDNIFELIIEKNTHGSVGTEEIYFDSDKQEFSSLEEDLDLDCT